MESADYLQEIYLMMLRWDSTINLITGIIQFGIACFAIYILYKLFNIFF